MIHGFQLQVMGKNTISRTDNIGRVEESGGMLLNFDISGPLTEHDEI